MDTDLLSRFFKGAEISFKKKPGSLVFLDETWAKTNMTRSHGRCPRGQRLRATRPTVTGKR